MTSLPATVVFTHRPTIWSYRHLLLALAGRDLRARYRQSFLGLYWSVVNPLVQTIVMTFAFVTIMKVGTSGIAFPVLYFSGVLFWGFFTSAVTSAMGSVQAQVYLLEKHRFPIVILPLASILARGVDFVISLGVFVLLVAWEGMTVPNAVGLWLAMIALVLPATVGLGLLTAALNVLYRDVAQVVGIVFTLGFFLTPVIYEVKTVEEPYRWWLLLNPVAAAIHGARQSLFVGEIPPLEEFLPSIVCGLVVFAVGWVAFRRLASTFTEVL